MCATGSEASSKGFSAAHDAQPYADSRLSRSLKRGHFAQTFGKWEVIGSGSFGTVLKAWHLEEQQYYAVKFIDTKVRAHETIEDTHESWSGPDVFKRLQNLESPHVVKYVRYWSELPEDLPSEAVGRDPKTPGTPPPVCSNAVATATAETEYSEATSDGGFEWVEQEASTTQKEGEKMAKAKTESTKAGSDMSSLSPTARSYRVFILEQMELIEGVTLAQWLSQPALRTGMTMASYDRVLQLFTQVVRGLSDLHKAGIVHCDVKPANIMVTAPSAQIKFFDFGSAALRADEPQQQGSRIPHSPDDQESLLTALGTPGYAAPEHCALPGKLTRTISRQSSRDSLGCRTHSDSDGAAAGSEGVKFRGERTAGQGADIFSAGIILVEFLMVAAVGGAAWRTAMERAQALAQVRAGELPAAVLRHPDVQSWARQLAIRMTAWDAAARPAAPEALQELQAGLGVASRRSLDVMESIGLHA